MLPVKEEEVALSKCYNAFKQDNDPRVYLTGCQEFCKQFSITNAKEIIEGHFGKLLYLYNKIRSEGVPPTIPIFTEFDQSVEFDFSFVSPVFFESNLNGYDLSKYTAVYEDDGIELFFISAKSNLVYQSEMSSSSRMRVFLAAVFLLFN